MVIHIAIVVKVKIILEDLFELTLVESKRQIDYDVLEFDPGKNAELKRIILNKLFPEINVKLCSFPQDILDWWLFYEGFLKHQIYSCLLDIIKGLINVTIPLIFNVLEASHQLLVQISDKICVIHHSSLVVACQLHDKGNISGILELLFKDSLQNPLEVFLGLIPSVSFV